jgi:hypothetical protein
MVIGPKLVELYIDLQDSCIVQINIAMAISEIYATIMAIFEDSP